jgi:3-isopropylmalate dehydratase small subunit
VENLFQEFKGSPLDIEIFLEKKLIKSNDREINFEVDNNLLERIIFGLDDVDITLRNKEAISVYEEKRMIEKPWIYKND